MTYFDIKCKVIKYQWGIKNAIGCFIMIKIYWYKGFCIHFVYLLHLKILLTKECNIFRTGNVSIQSRFSPDRHTILTCSPVGLTTNPLIKSSCIYGHICEVKMLLYFI